MDDSHRPAAKTLILAPHVDDEVLGCSCFLDERAHVLHLGVEDRQGISRDRRLEEVSAAATVAGFTWNVLDFEVNRYACADLVAGIEEAVERVRPTTILIPDPSYNQDHRTTYDAGMVAARPHDRNWFVSNVLLYEQPHSVMWRHGGEHEPNSFYEIDIANKLALYELYGSQVRGHRSPEVIKALARLRGAQIRVPYAEGFFVKRQIGAGVL